MSKPTAVFLGAGASKPFGYLLTREVADLRIFEVQPLGECDDRHEEPRHAARPHHRRLEAFRREALRRLDSSRTRDAHRPIHPELALLLLDRRDPVRFLRPTFPD